MDDTPRRVNLSYIRGLNVNLLPKRDYLIGLDILIVSTVNSYLHYNIEATGYFSYQKINLLVVKQRRILFLENLRNSL